MASLPTPRSSDPAAIVAVDITPVRPEQVEQNRTLLAAKTTDPRAGIFGAASISWKINRESALFLGAGRAALLQLAHPWVATALEYHSTLRANPLARFHNTFRVIFTMIFGTLDQALFASRQLYRLHSGIEGKLPEQVAAYSQGSHYQANEVNALCWVYATLVDSALVAFECVLPPLNAEERELYYSESKAMAMLFGIPPEALPRDWAAFQSYYRAMVNSTALGVNALSRELADAVLQGRGSRIPVPRWYRALTASWLPPHLREEFRLDFAVPDKAAAARAQRRLPRVYRRLPAMVRFVGPYHEAQARLQGRDPSSLIRANNRFWMGQPLTMFDKSDP